MSETKRTLLASALALAACAAHSTVPMMPTIGRVVHYYPSGAAGIERGEQPCVGLITQVWGSAYDNGRICVNVAYVNSGGTWSSASSTWLYHPDAEVPEGDADRGFALWMPFQSGKREASAPQLDPATIQRRAAPPDATLTKIAAEDNGVPIPVGQDASGGDATSA